MLSGPLVILSGGQSGVDRAALDAALAAGVAVGGWCPAGRWAEDGPIPSRYPLRETPTPDPAERTRRNVADADALLVLTSGPLAGGTARAVAHARALGRPVGVIDAASRDAVDDVVRWLASLGAARRVLNVAGPRESEAPGIYTVACSVLAAAFRTHRGETPQRDAAQRP